jgi:hypothetical protein
MKDIKPSCVLATAGSLRRTGKHIHREFGPRQSRTIVDYYRADVFDIYGTSKHSVDDNNRIRQGLDSRISYFGHDHRLKRRCLLDRKSMEN